MDNRNKEVVIIVDMLKGFLVEGHPLFCGRDSLRIIPPVVSLLKSSEGGELIYLCDNHRPDDPEFKVFPQHCIDGTEEAEIIDELEQFKGRIIKKTRFSGFFKTTLEDDLKRIKPAKVILCGVCTDICVLYTAADLRNRDYHVEVKRDCVSSFNAEGHAFALKHMKDVLGVEVA